MPDDNPNPALSATQGAGAGQSQAATGATTVDLVAEVQKAAAKAQQESERVSLESFTNPEDRKRAEALVAKAINDYRDKAVKEGKFLTPDDFERRFREQVQVLKVEQEATQKFWEHMADMGIKPNSEDYKKFVAEVDSGFYDKSKLGDANLVKRIAQAAQVGQYRSTRKVEAEGTPYLSPTGTPLGTDKSGAQSIAADPHVAKAQEILKQRFR